MATLAALAAFAAARPALALHTTLQSEPLRSETTQDHMPAGHGSSAATENDWLFDEDTPAAVQAELDDRRRKLERLERDTESVAIDAHTTGSHKRRQAGQSLWLSGTSRQAMTNYNDVQYVSFLEVGNQTLSGILDTGSFELVVFSTVCDSCGQASRYNPDLSTNHTPGALATVQQYGSGDLFCQEAWDMVSIGPYPPKKQSFWEVTSAKMPVLQYSAFQSIIGIGPPETPVLDADELLQAAIDNVSNYTAAGLPVPSDLQSAVEDRRKVSAALRTKSTMVDTFGVDMYSVCLGKKPGSDGYLVWSDTAPLVKPEYFKRVQVVGKHTWSVRMTEPRFAHDPASTNRKYDGWKLGCKDGCGALLDSGTSLIAIPGQTVNDFVSVTLEPWFDCTNLTELPSFRFKLGGQELILPPDAIFSYVTDSPVPGYLQSFVRMRKLRVPSHRQPGGHCELMIMESGASSAQGPLWILGVPFFRQYYTTFEVSGRSKEHRAVHLARASENCYPAAPGDDPKFPPRAELYQRLIDPAKLWVPPSIHSALRSDYVFL